MFGGEVIGLYWRPARREADPAPRLGTVPVSDCPDRFRSMAALFRPDQDGHASAIRTLMTPCDCAGNSCSLQGRRVQQAGREALLRLAQDPDPNALAAESTRLFGGSCSEEPGPALPAVSPCATTYVSGSRHRTRAFDSGIYREVGFLGYGVELEPDCPCHVANELEFVAHCLDLRHYGSDLASAQLEEFARGHLSGWIVLFAAATAARAMHPVLRFAGLALEQLVYCEKVSWVGSRRDLSPVGLSGQEGRARLE